MEVWGGGCLISAASCRCALPQHPWLSDITHCWVVARWVGVGGVWWVEKIQVSCSCIRATRCTGSTSHKLHHPTWWQSQKVRCYRFSSTSYKSKDSRSSLYLFVFGGIKKTAMREEKVVSLQSDKAVYKPNSCQPTLGCEKKRRIPNRHVFFACTESQCDYKELQNVFFCLSKKAVTLEKSAHLQKRQVMWGCNMYKWC